MVVRAGVSALISARRSPTGSTASRPGTRWAAAALALGLGLAAPGMTGLARADSPDTPSPATSAAAADPRAAATRPATTRAANPARDTQARSTPRAAAATGPANPRHNRATEIIRAAESLDSATASPSAASAESLPMPVPDLPTGDSGDSPESGNGSVAVTHIDSPAVVDSSASSDRSVSAAGTGLITAVNPTARTRPTRTAAPALDAQPPTTIQTALSAITQQIDQVLNGLINWLSALPASPLTPVTDFLAGALQLVRRALEPVLGWVRGTNVTVVNRSEEKLSLRPRGCQDSTCEAILDPGQSRSFQGYDESRLDVALRVSTVRWEDFEDDDYPERGTWVGDELRMIVYAGNEWIGDPQFLVYANPYAPKRDRPDELVNTAYAARKYEKSRFTNPWKGLKEGEGCSCDAPTSGGPLEGGQMVYIGRDKDSDDYKNWTLEIFALPTTKTDEYPAETNDKRIARTFYCGGKGANTWDV